VAQRLVRKLCSDCKKIVSDPTLIEKIKKDLADVKDEIKSWSGEIKIYEAVGCDNCGHTGYKGRIGVFEMLFVNEGLEKLIGQNPSHQQILAEAKKQCFVTMYQDGLMRVLAGETTLDEVRRVTSVDT
jgi:type II secretory ATPase GspE/PulE/Tfp pilus assembly ATPase PilB-like protein